MPVTSFSWLITVLQIDYNINGNLLLPKSFHVFSGRPLVLILRQFLLICYMAT